MMKILLLTTHLNTGGITSYLLTLAKELRAGGDRVFLVSAGGGQEEAFRRLGVQVINLPIRTKSELSPRIYAALGKVSRLIREQGIDVIHSQTRVTQVMGTLLSRMTGRGHVTTCHGFFRPRWFRRMWPCWGDAVIAVSPAVKEHLERDFDVKKDRIVQVINGIDPDHFSPVRDGEKEDIQRKHSIPAGPVVGIIARLSDVKGHDVLIRAMTKIGAEVGNAQLVIVGTGKTEAMLKRLVQQLGLNASVHFLPVVNRTREILPLFDLFVLPSLSEGLGLSVLEAQAAGVPVIASRVGGLPHLVEEGKTGVLVEPGNVDALAAAVLTLLKDPQTAARMAQRARDKVLREFSSEHMTEKTRAVYGRVRKEKA